MEFRIQNRKVIEYITENEINMENFLEVYTELDRYMRKDRQNTLEYNSVLNSIQSQTDFVRELINNSENLIQGKMKSEIQEVKELIDLRSKYDSGLSVVSEKVDSLSEIVRLTNKNDNMTLKQYLGSEISGLKEIIQSENGLETMNLKLDNILTEYKETMSKFDNNSQIKGQISEQIIYNELIEVFLDSEVINNTNKNNMGDFWIEKDNCPTIMIDVKNYKANVPRKEIDKFKKDAKMNQVCGILFSVETGISNKKDFQVELYGNSILVYISKGKLSVEKIKFASQIIYSVSEFIKNNDVEDIIINEEIVKKLESEFQNFKTQKEKAMKYIKNSISVIEQIQFPILNSIINKEIGSEIKEKKIKCEICGKELANKYSLQRHKNSH